jgi:hypothetical protein
MAQGLRYDPYSQPREFMDDIVGQMRESFSEKADAISASVTAKLMEVDAALAAINDVKVEREQAYRMECLRLAAGMIGGQDPGWAATVAEKLTTLVLTGRHPARSTETTVTSGAELGREYSKAMGGE